MSIRLSTDQLFKLVSWDAAAILDAAEREVDEAEVFLDEEHLYVAYDRRKLHRWVTRRRARIEQVRDDLWAS